MAIIKKFLQYRNKKLEEETTIFADSDFRESDESTFMKVYKKAYIKGVNKN